VSGEPRFIEDLEAAFAELRALAERS